jgi:hypothetical protein
MGKGIDPRRIARTSVRFDRRADRLGPAWQASMARTGASVRPPTWIRAWPLMIAGLAIQLGAAAGNPWGLGDDDPRLGAAAGTGDVSYPGAVVRQAPDSEWTDDRSGTWDADGSSIDDGRRYGARPPDQAPARFRDASSAAEWGWGERRQQADDHDPGLGFRSDSFRSEPGDGRADAGRRAGPDDAADAPGAAAEAEAEAGYRFRGDPPNAGGGWRTQAPDGRYQFRPLSEQERGRQEQSQGWRPAPTGRGQGRSPGPAPADTTPGLEPPWQSR